MTGSLAVWRKELTIYFATPIFYLTGFFFLLLAGYFFYSNLVYYTVLSFQAGQNPYLANMLTPSQMVYRPFFGNLGGHLFIYRAVIHHAPSGRRKALRNHGAAFYFSPD